MRFRIRGAGLFVGLLVLCGGLFRAMAEEGSGTIVFKGQMKRDPFIPLITPTGYLLNLEPEKDTALNLEGIMFDPKGDSIAIVNGEIVRVGDEISGGVVVRIEPGRISMLKDNTTSDIELRREE